MNIIDEIICDLESIKNCQIIDKSKLMKIKNLTMYLRAQKYCDEPGNIYNTIYREISKLFFSGIDEYNYIKLKIKNDIIFYEFSYWWHTTYFITFVINDDKIYITNLLINPARSSVKHRYENINVGPLTMFQIIDLCNICVEDPNRIDKFIETFF